MKRSFLKAATANRLRERICVLCALPVISLWAASAEAAEAEITIRANIIGFEDAKIMCGGSEPPTWCPAHLRKEANIYDRKQRHLEEARKRMAAEKHRERVAVPRVLNVDSQEAQSGRVAAR